ncbi:hypothetical protein L218DRAFT_987628 [Marasmius fiardii PR-910]|nr:hypothetical protein L218DRAFT_987628 [Marasmius fiardii PR-910]
MLLAQRVELTLSSFEEESLALSHHITDAPLSRWSSSRCLSSWETTQLAGVVPPSPLILDEEFAKVKIRAESPSTSPSHYSHSEVHESREEFPPSFIPLLHPDLRKLCEGEESDVEIEDHSDLDEDYVFPEDQLPPTDQVLDSENETTFYERGVHDEDDIVPFLYSLNQTIFMESLNPEIAPHIVITLCEDTWDDQTVAWYNRVDFQSPNYLHIPPSDVSEFISHPSHDYRVMNEPRPTSTSTTPLQVFSRPKLQKLIDRSSVERLIMFEVILVLRKQLCRKVAFEASRLASSLRHRYDSHPTFKKFENSFRWIDPAESLLSCYRRYRGTTFIESPSPFRVPHIVISAPPPENPWFKWSNQVNDPQDHGFGQYLVVSARGVEFVNEPEEPFYGNMCYADPEAYEYSECSGVSYTSTIESYRFFVADDSEEDDVHSPELETPIDGDEVEDFKTNFERALDFKFSRSSTSPSLEDHRGTRNLSDEDFPPVRCGTNVLMNEYAIMERERDVERLSRPSCRPYVLPSTSENDWSSFNHAGEEEDDDDLPPLDEWYQSVMRRTDAMLQAGVIVS